MYKLRKPLILLACTFIIWIFVHEIGPLDILPRVDRSVVSPDGALTVTIYRHKTDLLNPFASTQMVVEVKDAQGKMVYKDELWKFGARARWDTFSGEDDIHVVFESDNIVISRSPYNGSNQSGWAYVIRKDWLVRKVG